MMLDVRYPPYSNSKLARFRAMTEMRPNFDRQGNASGGFIWALIGLGSKSKVGAGFRWIVLYAIVSYAMKYARESKL